MNISICNICNNNCSYCFQSQYNNKEKKEFITLDHYEYLLKYINYFRSEIRIIGGEPTLHPQIYDIVKLTSDYGYRAILITNLSLKEQLLKEIIKINNVFLFINATQPYNRRENFENNLQFLFNNNFYNFGLSFCFTNNDYDNENVLLYLEHLCQKFNKYQLNFRISPASPAPGKKYIVKDYSNYYLKANDILLKYNAKCVFDCPQTFCSIPLDTLNILEKSPVFEQHFLERGTIYEKCRGALDILLDDKLYLCNSLNNIGIDIKDYNNVNDCYNALIFKVSELMNEENTYKFCDKNCQFLYDCQGFCPAIVNNFLQFNKE